MCALKKIIDHALNAEITGAIVTLETPLGRQTVLSRTVLDFYCVLGVLFLFSRALRWTRSELAFALLEQPRFFLGVRRIPRLGRGIVRLLARIRRRTEI